MKRFITMYSIISIIILSIVVLASLQLHLQSRSIAVFTEVANNAHETSDFDDFIGYQSIAYKNESETNLIDADIYIYQAIGEQDGVRMNQFVVVVNDNDTFDHAIEITDTNDQSNIKIVDVLSSTEIFSLTDQSSYNGEALSYGMEVYGFFYAATVIESDSELRFEVYGYDGSLYYSEVMNVTLADTEDLSGLTLGMTASEIETLINRDVYVTPEVIKDVTYFLILDIVLGGVIVFFIKRKNR